MKLKNFHFLPLCHIILLAIHMPLLQQRQVKKNKDLKKKIELSQVISALETIFDPEIPVNIYDLGLIYDIKLLADNNINIKMSLTAPGCPVAGEMPGQVADTIAKIPDVGLINVELVWEPAWTKDRMSEDAKMALEIY